MFLTNKQTCYIILIRRDNKMGYQRLVVEIDEKIKDDFVECVQSEGKTIKDVVENLLTDYIIAHKIVGN